MRLASILGRTEQSKRPLRFQSSLDSSDRRFSKTRICPTAGRVSCNAKQRATGGDLSEVGQKNISRCCTQGISCGSLDDMFQTARSVQAAIAGTRSQKKSKMMRTTQKSLI